MAFTEVHRTSKPALHGRPVAASALLLLIVVALAAGMSWRRAHDPLAPVIALRQFGASFRPPKQFVRFQPLVQGSTLMLHFQSDPTAGPVARLTYWRFEPRQEISAERLAEFVMGELEVGTVHRSAGDTVKATKRLGGHDGVEMTSSGGSSLARAVVLSSGTAFAVSLDVDDGPIGGELYQLFDQSCDSFVFNSD